MKYSYSFDFLQPIKNVKTILAPELYKNILVCSVLTSPLDLQILLLIDAFFLITAVLSHRYLDYKNQL